MSDLPQGPGWWLASDGRWYPPEARSPAAPPPPPPAPGAPGGRPPWAQPPGTVPSVPRYTHEVTTPRQAPVRDRGSRNWIIAIVVVGVLVGLPIAIAIAVAALRTSTSDAPTRSRTRDTVFADESGPVPSEIGCETELRTVKTATEAYYAQNQRWPADLAELVRAGLLQSDAGLLASYSIDTTTGRVTQGACPG